MFCPFCGYPFWGWEVVFGGRCKWGCNRCDKKILCRCTFTNKITKHSKPLYNPIKAMIRSYRWELENL